MINLASLTNWNFFYALPTYKISKRYIYNVFNIYIYIWVSRECKGTKTSSITEERLSQNLRIEIIINQKKIITLFVSSKIDSLN